MNPATVLVVEDEVIVSKDIMKTLETFQYHPLCAVITGDEAVIKAREYRPDVVLMDIHIPGTMDGLGAARIIRDELHIPVIFVTAFADDITLDKAKDVTPYGYVLKPFTDLDLKVAIEIALSRKAAEIKNKLEPATQTHRDGETLSEEKYSDTASLSDIRSLLLENFFNDIVLLLYNNVEEKELVISSFIERTLKTTGNVLFAFSISKAHRNYLPEIQQGKIRICRIKDGDVAPLKKILSDALEQSDRSDPATPLKFLIDFSAPCDDQEILAIVDLVLEIQKTGIPVFGIISVLVGADDDDLIKIISKRIPKVVVTTSQGTVISCADYSFPFEHLSFLPQDVVDEIVKKVLEPVILSLLQQPISGYDILQEIRKRYNVSIPKARVYMYLYSLEKMGYLTTSNAGKSKLYLPTESGRMYIQQKLNEFNSVFHHIQAEIISRQTGLTIKESKDE
jgi:CheY-like chemotaxis protein/DNA-binding PadR family transcriptional regulator